MREKNWLSYGVILIVSFFLVADLFFHPGRSITFDGHIHITTIAQFHNALKDGEFPVRWSIDGNVLYTALPEEGRRAMQLARVDLATGKRTVWKNLVPADAVGATRIGNPMVSPDGSAYAYTYGSHVSDLYLVDGLK